MKEVFAVRTIIVDNKNQINNIDLYSTEEQAEEKANFLVEYYKEFYSCNVKHTKEVRFEDSKYKASWFDLYNNNKKLFQIRIERMKIH